MQPHGIKSITESGAIRSSAVSEESWTTLATEILNFEAFAISWILNYWQFYWLKWNLPILAKGNCNNSERGVWIRDGNWFLVLHKRMQSMLSLLVKSNDFTVHFFSSTYLIHEIYVQLKKKREMYVEIKKTNRNVSCKKLRKFSELYIGLRYR